MRLLFYAKKHDGIIILYAHKPTATVSDAYGVSYRTLHEICGFVSATGMKFLTLHDLAMP